jgi:hypothetical protein
MLDEKAVIDSVFLLRGREIFDAMFAVAVICVQP